MLLCWETLFQRLKVKVKECDTVYCGFLVPPRFVVQIAVGCVVALSGASNTQNAQGWCTFTINFLPLPPWIWGGCARIVQVSRCTPNRHSITQYLYGYPLSVIVLAMWSISSTVCGMWRVSLDFPHTRENQLHRIASSSLKLSSVAFLILVYRYYVGHFLTFILCASCRIRSMLSNVVFCWRGVPLKGRALYSGAEH